MAQRHSFPLPPLRPSGSHHLPPLRPLPSPLPKRTAAAARWLRGGCAVGGGGAAITWQLRLATLQRCATTAARRRGASSAQRRRRGGDGAMAATLRRRQRAGGGGNVALCSTRAAPCAGTARRPRGGIAAADAWAAAAARYAARSPGGRARALQDLAAAADPALFHRTQAFASARPPLPGAAAPLPLRAADTAVQRRSEGGRERETSHPSYINSRNRCCHSEMVRSPVPLSRPDGPGQGTAIPDGPRTVCWLPALGGSRPARETSHPSDINQRNKCCVTWSDQGGHQCPCGTQMGQDKARPSQTDPAQCAGSLCSLGAGLHGKLATHPT